jgi:hypothetical protein
MIPTTKTTKGDLVEYCLRSFGPSYKKLSNKKRKDMWTVTVDFKKSRSAIINYYFVVSVREPEWEVLMKLRWS